MAHKKKTAEEIKNEVKNAYVELESGLQELMTSEKYLDFLNTMAERPRYSLNNTILIYLQKPNATFLAGYSKFREIYGHQVKQGEKGIKIFAPIIRKKKDTALLEEDLEKNQEKKGRKNNSWLSYGKNIRYFPDKTNHGKNRRRKRNSL